MKVTDPGRYMRRFIFKDGEVSLTKEFEADLLRYYRVAKHYETEEELQKYVREMCEYHRSMYLSIRYNDSDKIIRHLIDYELYECDGCCQSCIHNGRCASQKYAEEIKEIIRNQ